MAGGIAAVLLAVALPATASAQGQTPAWPPALDGVMANLAIAVPESESEAQAMSVVIAAVRRGGTTPAVPAEVAERVAQAAARTKTARSPAEFAALAADLNAAARSAPWMADYHFAHGNLLAKAGDYPAAVRAFSLYLEAAPEARDRDQVRRLIAGLRERPASGASPVRPLINARRAGEVFRDCPMCPEMVVMPAGHFVMGSPAGEVGRFDSEGPQHNVTVTGFALGKYPVTEDEFVAFLAATGYQPAPCNRILDKTWRSLPGGVVFPPGMADLPRQPAVCVNWRDAGAYIAWLNGKAHLDAHMGAYRLPSEAEWEYAARAGTTTARWWGEAVGANQANCHGCGSQWDNTLIAPVGNFGPNAFGLFDVLGNSWEWMADCWNENYAGAPVDGSVWDKGDCTKHVMRGGSWSNLPVFIRSAARSRGDAGGADFDYSSYVGFRLARSLP